MSSSEAIQSQASVILSGLKKNVETNWEKHKVAIIVGVALTAGGIAIALTGGLAALPIALSASLIAAGVFSGGGAAVFTGYVSFQGTDLSGVENITLDVHERSPQITDTTPPREDLSASLTPPHTTHTPAHADANQTFSPQWTPEQASLFLSYDTPRNSEELDPPVGVADTIHEGTTTPSFPPLTPTYSTSSPVHQSLGFHGSPASQTPPSGKREEGNPFASLQDSEEGNSSAQMTPFPGTSTPMPSLAQGMHIFTANSQGHEQNTPVHPLLAQFLHQICLREDQELSEELKQPLQIALASSKQVEPSGSLVQRFMPGIYAQSESPPKPTFSEVAKRTPVSTPEQPQPVEVKAPTTQQTKAFITPPPAAQKQRLSGDESWFTVGKGGKKRMSVPSPVTSAPAEMQNDPSSLEDTKKIVPEQSKREASDQSAEDAKKQNEPQDITTNGEANQTDIQMAATSSIRAYLPTARKVAQGAAITGGIIAGAAIIYAGYHVAQELMNDECTDDPMRSHGQVLAQNLIGLGKDAASALTSALTVNEDLGNGECTDSSFSFDRDLRSTGNALMSTAEGFFTSSSAYMSNLLSQVSQTTVGLGVQDCAVGVQDYLNPELNVTASDVIECCASSMPSIPLPSTKLTLAVGSAALITGLALSSPSFSVEEDESDYDIAPLFKEEDLLYDFDAEKSTAQQEKPESSSGSQTSWSLRSVGYALTGVAATVGTIYGIYHWSQMSEEERAAFQESASTFAASVWNAVKPSTSMENPTLLQTGTSTSFSLNCPAGDSTERVSQEAYAMSETIGKVITGTASALVNTAGYLYDGTASTLTNTAGYLYNGTASLYSMVPSGEDVAQGITSFADASGKIMENSVAWMADSDPIGYVTQSTAGQAVGQFVHNTQTCGSSLSEYLYAGEGVPGQIQTFSEVLEACPFTS